MENIREMNIEAERAGLRIQQLREKHKCLPQDAGFNWGSGGARDQAGEEMRTRIGESCPEDDEDTITTD